MASFLDHLRMDRYTVATVAISTGIYLLYILVGKVRAFLSAPVRDLPGPKSINWLTGSLPRHVWEPDSQDYQLEWTRQYGPNFRYYGWFNVRRQRQTIARPSHASQLTRVLTMDLQALNYILNSPEFEKTDDSRTFLGDVLGKGQPKFTFNFI